MEGGPPTEVPEGGREEGPPAKGLGQGVPAPRAVGGIGTGRKINRPKVLSGGRGAACKASV